MKITETDVEYVAKLANIEVPQRERQELAEQLSRIVDYVEQLNQVDVTGIEPTPQVVTSARHAIRDDRAVARIGSSDPAKNGKVFKVPKVITER